MGSGARGTLPVEEKVQWTSYERQSKKSEGNISSVERKKEPRIVKRNKLSHEQKLREFVTRRLTLQKI